MRLSNKEQRNAAVKTLVTLCLLAALNSAHAQTVGGMAAAMARLNAAEVAGQAAAEPFIAQARAAMAVGDGKTAAAAARAAINAAITPILVEQSSSMGLSAAASALGNGPKK